MDNLDQEFRIIDANHKVITMLHVENELLRILLSELRGEFVHTSEKRRKDEIAKSFPSIAERYGVVALKRM